MEDTVAEYEARVLDVLLEKVHRCGGYDFRGYKRGTVMRRLERRLQATGSKTYLDYMHYLDTHPEEYQKFAEYLTIKVSGFFRSPYTFHQVAGLVLPELVSYKKRRGERSLRFWSAACARGEEPYSIAIMLAEFLGQQRRNFDISIYATDISRQALKEVQAGIYSSDDVENLPSNILETYFTRRGEGYEVRSDIRQMVNFSCVDLTATIRQSLLDLDCIFCCNVLIYLQRQLQDRVLGMLYDSLTTPGYLVLGEMETPTGNLCGKLECLDSKAKIYKKKVRTN
ncbi:MAG: CheR family methyltransferase [Dehalococcoidales bacterium]